MLTAEWRIIWRKINIIIIIIFSFLLSTCNRNTYFQTINQYFVVYRFVSEWKRQVVIEQKRFLCTLFLCSEFKWENIYSGVNFCGKNVCGNFYLRELILRIAGKTAKNAKIRTRNNFVPHGKYVTPHRVGFLCFFALKLLNSYRFCPFWSGIGYGFRGNYHAGY